MFLRTITVIGVAFLPLVGWSDDAPAGADLTEEVGRLVSELGADAEGPREAARERLLELGGPTTERGEQMLKLLPEPIDEMPASVRDALQAIRKTIAERIARLAVTASRVTIDVVQAPLEEVLASIEQQTGNELTDLRDRFGQQAAAKRITLSIQDAPFWEAVDQTLDEAGMGVYSYSGEDAVALVNREPGATPRWGAADYAGPLRIEATRVTAARDLRRVTGESLNLQLEIAWEPRLRPIAFSQPLSDIEALNESGDRLSLARPEQSIDIEVSPGGQAAEMTLPMVLPTRKTTTIATLRGQLNAVIPGREATFRFEKLTGIKEPVTKNEGGASIVLQRMRKSGEVWELHMRLRLESADKGNDAESAFASHRGWVFNNITYLEDADGNRVEHAGFETTMQQGNEIGLAYLFEIPPKATSDDGNAGKDEDESPGDPADYVWVYRTPTSIERFPVEYELHHIPLP